MKEEVGSRFSREEQRVYALISRSDGLKAREIAAALGMDRSSVSRLLVQSALMREMCYQDGAYRWHALIRQQAPHEGLELFAGWYGRVAEFLAQEETEWLTRLREGCQRIGRNLNDTRGLIHSFLDCGQVMRGLFADLREMDALPNHRDWELAFELRLNRARYIRIYADVLLIAGKRAFTLEFKMKDQVDPEEVLQAAKYVPYLEMVLGPEMDVIPALVLTGRHDYFDFVPIGRSDGELAACSGDMLFNVLNEYMGFLRA
ncbi:MAG: MarR family transcriptional regulator [Clostridia bacterium]|nr:MarR family transcriptional regulator [Clostridia bacterium]